jgi:ABC-2 type transport system permease protein
MKNLRMICEVARWEFLRFFKLRDLVLTLVLTAFGAAVGLWSRDLIDWVSRGSKAKLVVLNQETLPFQLPAKSAIELVPGAGRSDDEWRAAVGRKEVAGLLVLRSIDEAELFVYKQPVWQAELATALSSARREARLKRANLSAQELNILLVPFQIDIRFHGEKQLRVTEQVVAAISPQTWIDGKILGLSAMVLVAVLNLGGGALLAVLASRLFGASIPIPLAMIHPILLLQFLTMAMLGFLLWFTFLAAIAATINDPQTSARNVVMFLPALPLSIAFSALNNPDTWLMKLLGVLPFTSPAVMPARLVLTDVAWWEFLTAIVLLLGAIWLLRRAAGKIFGVGMLMYGKEPSWREVWRWVREA